MGATAELARFVHDVRFEDMPKEAVDKAKEMFFDTIGVALSGTLVASGRIAVKYAMDVGGIAEASVFPNGFRTSASMAAFTNGLLAHNQDFDDWVPSGTEKDNWLGNSGHVSCVMVPATLALGEKLSVSGSSLLLAYVIGVEIYSKVGGACRDARARGFHAMGIYGPVGAAAAAAKLLKLNVHNTIMAIGIATSAASGLYFGNQRAFTNPFHSGHAARTGVEAALLAKEGFTSNDSMLELPMGFCDAYHGQGGCDYNKMTSNLGKPFNIVSPGLAIKPYPCARPTFSPLEGVLSLKKEHNITCDDVQQVDVLVSPQQYERFNVPEPATGYPAKFSYNFICASALIDGRVDRNTFADAKLQDPRVKETMAKVKIIVEEARKKEGSLLPYATVVIKLKNGREYKKLVLVPKGHPNNPLSYDEILTKYRENAGSVLDQKQVERSIELIGNLEKVKNVQELIGTLMLMGTS